MTISDNPFFKEAKLEHFISKIEHFVNDSHFQNLGPSSERQDASIFLGSSERAPLSKVHSSTGCAFQLNPKLVLIPRDPMGSILFSDGHIAGVYKII